MQLHYLRTRLLTLRCLAYRHNRGLLLQWRFRLLDDSVEVDSPIVIAQQPIERAIIFILPGPELKEVLHQNFADCSPLADALSNQDTVVYCLGTYTGSVSDEQLRVITYYYAIVFARVFRDSSPDAAFSFLSGSGADPTGRSRLAFARYNCQT